MKWNRVILSCLLGVALCLLAHSGQSKEVQVWPSKIVQVKLHPSLALVEREAEVYLKKGLNQVYLDCLVPIERLDLGSLMGNAPKGTIVLGVQVKSVPLSDSGREDVKELEKKIRKLKEQLSQLDARISGINQVEAFLKAWFGTGGKEEKETIVEKLADPSGISGWIDALSNQWTDLEKEKAQLQFQREDLKDRLEALENELKKISGEKKKVVFAMGILSPKEQSAKVSLTYAVRGNFWEPSYRVLVDRKEEKAKVYLDIEVHQDTGEDWKGVKLSLSTVRPMFGTALPEAQTWRVYPEREKKGMLFGQLAGGGKAVRQVRMVNTLAYTPEYATSPLALTKDLGLAVEYEIAGQWTITADGSKYLIPVYSWDKDVVLYHYSVPRVVPKVFWAAEMENDKKFIPGLVRVYLDGTFVGESRLSGEKKEKLLLGLGEDARVKVSYDKDVYQLKDNLLGTAYRHQVKIKLVNLSDEPISVRLFDSLPVPAGHKVKVKVKKLDPKPDVEDYEDKKGVALWKITVPARSEKKIEEEYIISFSK